VRLISGLAGLITSGELHTPIPARRPLAQWREALAPAPRTGSEREGKVVF
jgi:NADPH:quinone reductase-like Zn-dependent oxidoreductase